MRWLPDVNIWLALCVPDHVHHRLALQWINKNERPIFFCRASQQGLLRLLTTSAVLAPYKMAALSNRQALSRMRDMMESERIKLADEPYGIEPAWKRFADSTTASPKLWMDAYLAAFAVVGGFKLITSDRAFKQFKGLNLQLL